MTIKVAINGFGRIGRNVARAIISDHCDEIDLLEVFLIVWKGKWTVILITALVLVSTIVFQTTNKPILKTLINQN